MSFSCVCNETFSTEKEFSKHFSFCKKVKSGFNKYYHNFNVRNKSGLKDYLLGEGFYGPSAQKGVDYVECPYCFKEGLISRFGVLTPNHFKLHNKTKEEVLREYPDLKLRRNKAYEKMKKTNKSKYGVENQFQTEKVKKIVKSRDKEFHQKRLEKQKQTNLEKYGVENYFQTEEVKNLIKSRDAEFYKKRQIKSTQTSLEKYGSEHYMKTQEGKEKLKEVFLEKHGVDNPMKIDHFKDKMIGANIENHDGFYNSQTSQWRLAIRKKWLAKNSNEINKITSQRQQTSLLNWGVDNPAKNEKVKSKIKTNLRESLGKDIAFSLIKSLAGYRPDLEEFFRSRWEANYARYLNSKGINWLYEPKTFVLRVDSDREVEKRGGSSIKIEEGSYINYTPDFFLGYFVEVKGIQDELSLLKVELFKSQYPKESKDFKLLSKSDYLELEKEFSSSIEYWEYDNFNIKTHPDYFGIANTKEILNKAIYRSDNYSKLSVEEKEELVNNVFDYYSLKGFPYIEEDSQLFNNTLNQIKLKKLEIKDKVSAPNINQNLFYFFLPHRWESKESSNLSPLEYWENPKSLKDLIRNRFKNSRIISDESMRTGLKILTKSPTNFNSVLTKELADNYLKNQGVLYDFCAGWGGRLVGAALSKKVQKYIGVDASTKTIEGLRNLSEWLINEEHTETEFDLNLNSSESFIPREEVELILTSPPYFNKEVYSKDESQSIIKYPDYESWFRNYLLKSCDQAISKLKKGGYFMIALSNTGKYKILDDFLAKFKALPLEKTIEVSYPQVFSNSWSEKILIYAN